MRALACQSQGLRPQGRPRPPLRAFFLSSADASVVQAERRERAHFFAEAPPILALDSQILCKVTAYSIIVQEKRGESTERATKHALLLPVRSRKTCCLGPCRGGIWKARELFLHGCGCAAVAPAGVKVLIDKRLQKLQLQ